MSDTKASAFGVIPALDRAADYVPILDMSASAGSNDRNKLITPDALFTGITTAAFRDTSAAFDVTQTFTSSTVLDDARSITWDVKNASHQLKFTAASIVTFPAGTNTLLGSAVANTITTNGAASTPALHGSGTIFSGGTATTTKPYWLIEPSGTTSTGWNTSGTLFGGNAPSGFVGNLIDLQLNGVPRFRVQSDGRVRSGEWYSTATGVNAVLSGGGALTLLGYSETLKVYLGSNEFGPWVDDEISLGTTAKGWKDAVINGSCDAGSFKVGGVAGVSGTITAASTVTVVNGIVTVIA